MIEMVRIPELRLTSVPAVPVTATAYSVIDMETGKIVFSHNAEKVLPIASVTKLFTAAVVQEASPEVAVIITAEDVATEGRAGKLEVGQTYQAQQLLFPLLLESSNDAATALERSVGPALLDGVPLADASGLSANNRASATALASELRSLYLSQRHIFDITRLKQYVGEYTGWVNNSPVHDLPGYQGGKHGYTAAAGKTLAAVFQETTVSDREFGYVILGSQDLRADTLALREAVAESVSFQ